MRVSPSQLQTFMDCALQWKFKKVDKLPTRQNGKASFGTCIHKALEVYNSTSNIDLARTVFLENWANPERLGVKPDYWPKYTSYNSLKAKGVEMLLEYHEKQKWETRTILAQEHHFCLVPGTPILTKRGIVAIEEVIVGDRVITHLGRWRKVLRTMCTTVSAELVNVRAKGLSSLTMTKDHPVFAASYTSNSEVAAGTRRRVLMGTEWVPAGELIPWKCASQALCDSLTLPLLQIPDSSDQLLFVDKYVRDRHIGYAVRDGWIKSNMPRSNPMRTPVPYSDALGRIVGLYLSEGSIEGGGKVSWSFHEDEVFLRAQLIHDIKLVFGLEAFEMRYKDWGRGVKVGCHSRFLADLLSCGTAKEKKFPEWAWAGGRGFFLNLLWGWMVGDGHETIGENVHRRGTTASYELAWHILLIALSCGKKASLRFRPANKKVSYINGHEVKSSDAYHVEWQDEQFRPGSYRLEKSYWTTPVRETLHVDYDGPVYNLEVEEDNSYLTTGGLVHNCVPFGEHELEGIVDLVELRKAGNGRLTLRIVDYKTASRAPSSVTLRFNLQFSSYIFGSLQEEFWLGNGLDFPPIENGEQWFHDLRKVPRKGIWYHLMTNKEINAGERDDGDFLRLYRLLHEMDRAIQADIFMPDISADTCTICDFTQQCGIEIPNREEMMDDVL